jgi:hypothetical protein
VEHMTSDINALRARMAGLVLDPDDDDYDEARALWNGDIDHRPALIAVCANAADVSSAIGLARRESLEISVRGGAHSAAGASVGDGGLTINLSQMRQVTVDRDTQRAHVGGGATLADMDAATQAHGLAVPGGIVSHTGVGGLAVGGGMGWLTRKAGLMLDDLVSAEVVTADGRILRASEEDNPDLFWAIRGGGSNFGVVTTFEFQLHEVGPMVRFGLFFWGLNQGTEVLRLAREVIATSPGDVSIILAGVNAPPEPFVPEQHRLAPGYALMVTGFGSAEEHALVAARIREALSPLFELVTPPRTSWPRTELGSAPCGALCSRTRSAWATSTPSTTSRRTGFGPLTGPPSTSGSPVSKGSTTRRTSSTATSTSHLRCSPSETSVRGRCESCGVLSDRRAAALVCAAAIAATPAR